MTVPLVNHLSSFWFTLIGAIAWHLLASRKSRAHSFFGVRVEPGFSASAAGRAILRQFRFRLWSLTAFAVVLVQFLGPAGVTTGIVLSFLFGGVAFAEAHRCTMRGAATQPVPTVRIASVAGEPGPMSPWLGLLDSLAMIVPPGIPAIALVVALNRRSAGGALLFFLCFSLSLGLMCAANQWALRFRARSSDWAVTLAASRRFRTLLGVMFSLIFTVPISMMSLMALLPQAPLFFATFLPLEAVLLFLVWRIRFWLAKHLDSHSSDPMSDSCWKWGWCYWNPSDPALVVPLRTGLGQSFNCGRLGVQVVMGVVMTLTAVSLVVTTLLSSKLAHMTH